MDSIIRLKGIAEQLDVSLMTVNRIRKTDTTFPKPIRLGARTIGFRVADLNEWLTAREVQS